MIEFQTSFRKLPQKSSVIVVGEARIFDKWSSWKYSFKGMISSNSTREIPEKKSNIRALIAILTLSFKKFHSRIKSIKIYLTMIETMSFIKEINSHPTNPSLMVSFFPIYK